MRPNEKINSYTPVDCYKSHRFCYFISDKNKKTTRRILLLPYLHENKIYLNRLKINTDYFYSSIIISPNEIINFKRKYNL